MSAKTLLERFGFQDTDRHGNKHDEIQIWAYHNFTHVIREVFPALVFDPASIKVNIEYPVTRPSSNYVVGFIDLYCRNLSIAIEVKTEIPTAGDLIRQIQLYRKFMSGTWIVVSPDDWCSSILRDQGIFFYKYGRNNNAKQLFLFS